MQLEAILSATLGLSSPWYLIEAIISDDRLRLDITIAYAPSEKTNSNDPANDAEASSTALWFNGSFLNYETYLHIQGPSKRISQDMLDLHPPWTRAGSRFVRLENTPGATLGPNHTAN